MFYYGGQCTSTCITFQLWLIFCGKVPKPWDLTRDFVFSDSAGNSIYIPTTSTISLIFSVLSILKAIIEFNIQKLHVTDIDDMPQFVKVLEIIASHLPYFVTSTFFRISSFVISLTYLNQFGFVPIFLLFIANLILGYAK